VDLTSPYFSIVALQVWIYTLSNNPIFIPNESERIHPKKEGNPMKSRIFPITLLLALFLSTASTAVFAKSKEKQLTPTTHVESQTTEITAKVKSINYDDRHVVLVGPAGNEVTVKVSEDVKNFKQIKKGDEVNVKYNESLVWFIRKKGEKVKPTKDVTTEASTASVGEKPAMDKSKTLDLVATITAIDDKTPAVTLKGPEGNSMTIKVRDPENLKGVKVGDQVDITYTESVAVNVEKAKKK
jgi:hypothetical protein